MLAQQNRNQSTALITILTEQGLDGLLKVESKLTVRTAMEGLPLFFHLKTNGRKLISATLDMQVTRLAASINVKHNLSSLQIQQIVSDILEMYPTETIEDFMLVFKRLRQGFYKKEFHQLDQAVIFTAIKDYLVEKSVELERVHLEEQQERDKPAKKELPNYEEMVEFYLRAQQQDFSTPKPEPKRTSSWLGASAEGYKHWRQEQNFNFDKDGNIETNRAPESGGEGIGEADQIDHNAGPPQEI